jgi:hypothetical protein
MFKKRKAKILNYFLKSRFRRVRNISYISGQVMTGLLNEKSQNRLNDTLFHDIYLFSEKMYDIILEKNKW